MKGLSDELELTNQSLRKFVLAEITQAEYLELSKVSAQELEELTPPRSPFKPESDAKDSESC